MLGAELVQAKKKEIRFRLREMKYALEYPGNRKEIELNSKIEMIINDDDSN